MPGKIRMLRPFGSSLAVIPTRPDADPAFRTLRLQALGRGDAKGYEFEVERDRDCWVALGYCQAGWPDDRLRMIDVEIEGVPRARFDLQAEAGPFEPFVKIFECRDLDGDGRLRVCSRGSPGLNVIWVFDRTRVPRLDPDPLIRGALNGRALYYVDCGNESAELLAASRIVPETVGAAPMPRPRPRRAFEPPARGPLPLGTRDIVRFLERRYDGSLDEAIAAYETRILQQDGSPALGKNAENPGFRQHYHDHAQRNTCACQRDLYDSLVWLYHDDRLGLADLRFVGYARQQKVKYQDQGHDLAIWRKNYDELCPARVTVLDRQGRPVAHRVRGWTWAPDRMVIEADVPGASIMQTTAVVDDVALCELRLTRRGAEADGLRLRCEGLLCDLGADDCVRAPRFEADERGGLLRLRPLDPPLDLERLVVAAAPGAGWGVDPAANAYGRTVPVEWNDAGEFVFAAAVGLGYHEEDLAARVESALAEPGAAFERRRADWNDYFNTVVPQFACSEPAYELYYYWTYYVHRANLVDAYWDRDARYPYFSAIRKGSWTASGGWDAMAHMCSEVWLNDPGMARHIAHLDTGYTWGYHAPALWKYWLRTREPGYLERAYALLESAEKQYAEMDGDGNGLPAWDRYHWDYPCCRWDEVKPLAFEDRRMREPVESVDRAALVCLNRQVLAALARQLGRPDEAGRWARRADETRRLVNELMWDEAQGFYFDVKERSKEKLRCKSAAAFYPLAAGIPDARQAARLLEHLRDPREFWTPCRVPNISRDWPGYAPGSYVDGIVWSHCNMVLLDGLDRIGRHDLIAELLDNWIHAYVKDGVPSNIEHLNPETGGWLHMDKMGYGGILVEGIVRYLCGIGPLPDGRLEVNPAALDPAWDRLDFAHFHYRGHVFDVRWRKGEGFAVRRDGATVFESPVPARCVLEAE